MTGQLFESYKGDILVVDDTLANLHLLRQLLFKHGYRVRLLSSGPAALAAIQAAQPDLILLDIMMPEMDGYEVCKILKADENTSEIPIIFLSALGETEDKLRAFRAGGVDYVTKPFQPDEVLARVETHLNLQMLKRELECHLAELQARNEELDAFAHTVAHDLKNPLANIVGFTSMLEDAYDDLQDEKRKELLHYIIRSSNKMYYIIEELMLLAGVRKQEVQQQALDMDMIVAGALERLNSVIHDAKAEIATPQSWPTAQGYAPWVEEVWANYISNAIKYGGEPPRVILGFDRPHEGLLRFWVRDNGNGLKVEDQLRLFTPFTRLDQVKTTGHGLGLSIVRRIVEKLGGQVGVDSQVGQGSLFYFTLLEY